jgi:hypothetical protein
MRKPSLIEDVVNLTALTRRCDGELKTNIEKFKGKHLPYGSYLEQPNLLLKVILMMKQTILKHQQYQKKITKMV